MTGRRWLPGGLLGLCFAALYFLTRSPSLDEWDSVQFALGVGHFNLWQHQPHPPGYPLYIAGGWAGVHLLGLDAPTALQLVSALGGGLSIACWFVMVRRRFPAPTAWMTASALGSLLIMWMCATKVLTDPWGAGLLALTLALAEEDAISPAWAGLAGAMAVGARPQNFAVVLLILCLRQPTRRRWATSVGAFLAGCLAWLLPVAWLQAHTPESAGNPWAYGAQLLHQWRWRFDQPKVFLGATGQSGLILQERLGRHFLDWLARGFGFPFKRIWGWLGIAMLTLGWTFHGLHLLRRDESGAPARAFWARHGPWALAYIAIVFACLPGDQRYYLPIYPLLILAAVAGWQSLPGRWGWSGAIVPAAALAVTLPFVGVNHTEPAPPVEIMRYLNAAHPPPERPQIWLILRDNRRHAEWYAADFHIMRAETFDPLAWPAAWTAAQAIYTDAPAVLAHPPDGKHWRLMCSFSRSPLIYRKHNEAALWRLSD